MIRGLREYPTESGLRFPFWSHREVSRIISFAVLRGNIWGYFLVCLLDRKYQMRVRVNPMIPLMYLSVNFSKKNYKNCLFLLYQSAKLDDPFSSDFS